MSSILKCYASDPKSRLRTPGTLPLADAADVVSDALALLASKEMRLSSVQRQKAPEV
jgi:hypothetical protein